MRRVLLQRLAIPERMRAAREGKLVADVAHRLSKGRDPFPKVHDVSKGLQELLAHTDKRAVERLAHGMTITDRELAGLIFNAGHFGFRHERFGYEKRPKHLAMTEKDERAFFFDRENDPEGAAKAFRKIEGLFRERRLYTAHVFANEAAWHVFSWSDYDAWLGRRGHGEMGPHLHYMSSVLYPRKKLDEIVRELREPYGEVHGQLHIRFRIERGKRVQPRRKR